MAWLPSVASANACDTCAEAATAVLPGVEFVSQLLELPKTCTSLTLRHSSWATAGAAPMTPMAATTAPTAATAPRRLLRCCLILPPNLVVRVPLCIGAARAQLEPCLPRPVDGGRSDRCGKLIV